MNIAILKTGLFPDAETVTNALEQFALEQFADNDPIITDDATRTDLTDADWDQILDRLLTAERIIVI